MKEEAQSDKNWVMDQALTVFEISQISWFEKLTKFFCQPFCELLNFREVKVKKFLPKMSSNVTNDAEEALKEMWL